MTDQEKIRAWVRAWNEAAPVLESIRQREVQETDNVLALAQMEPAFNLAVRIHRPTPTSGLIEMQRYFAKLRPRFLFSKPPRSFKPFAMLASGSPASSAASQCSVGAKFA